MSPSVSGTTDREKVFMAVVVGVVVGALALTAFPSLRVVSVAEKVQPEAPAPAVRVAAPAETEEPRVKPAAPVAPEESVGLGREAVAPPRVPRTSVEKPKQASGAIAKRWSEVSAPSSRLVAAAPATAGHLEPTTSAAAVTSPTTADDAMSQPVTISGCLEMTVDAEQFRLTETEGADAPKSRGWRSGFLTKRSAPVELTEFSDPAGLRKYVGLRVVATGLLTDRKLRVRSLQAEGTSCN